MNHEIRRAPVAVILAADIGSRLSPLTDKSPKSLLSVGGSVILERTMRNCLSCGISQFVLVLGHRAEEIKQFVAKTFRGVRVTYVINERYRDTNTGYSLMLAATAIGMSDFVKFDADIVFDVRILRELMDNEIQNALCVDSKRTLAEDGMKVSIDEDKRVTAIGKSVDPETALGVTIGIEKMSAKTSALLFAELRNLMETPASVKSDYQTAYAKLVQSGTPIYAIDIAGSNWIEVDTAANFEAANAMFGSPITTVSRGQQRVLDEATDDTRKRK